MVNLKSCPFCGGKATPISVEYWDTVVCTKCHAKIVRYKAHSKLNEAVKAWNSRYDEISMRVMEQDKRT